MCIRDSLYSNNVLTEEQHALKESLADKEVLIRVTPKITEKDKKSLEELATSLSDASGLNVALEIFKPDMDEQLAKADVYIGFAGQGTLSQALANHVKPIVTWLKQKEHLGADKGEQKRTVSHLAEAGYLTALNANGEAAEKDIITDDTPEDLKSLVIERFLSKLYEGMHKQIPFDDIQFGGAEKVADSIANDIKQQTMTHAL